MAPNNKSIKGITIEIAGDTKKLGDSLKQIQERSRDLSTDLKYVDKLLKFDPENTALLVEKQRMLTDAVANTCDELEALKSVQEQVTEQYASGQIGQRAYMEFQGEVARTEHKLMGLYAESEKVEKSLRDTGDEALDASSDLGELGNGADGATDELGGLDDMLGGLIKGGKIAAVAGLIGTAASKVGEIEEETREYREEMAKLDIAFESSKLIAEDADAAYSKLYRVLGETDQAVEASQQIALLAESTKDVTRWASVAPGLVSRFGDALQPETFYESANETLKLGEATGAFVQLLEGTGVITVDDFNKRLQELNDEEAKQQYMLGITELLLGDAAAAYEERNASVLAARDADARWQEAMADVGEALSPLATAAKNFGTDIVEWFVPKVQGGVDLLGDMKVAFGDMCVTFKEDWGEVSDWFGEKWDVFTSDLKAVNDSIRDTFGDTSDESKLAEQNLGQNFAAMAGHAVMAGTEISAAAYGIYDPWIGAGATIDEVCGGIYASYRETVSNVENTEWRIPKPKIPEFSISGQFALQPPSVPKLKVTWNAQGGILTEPTIFGALGGNLLGGGEAGQEAVLPLDSFYENLERIMARNSTGKQIVVQSPQFAVYAQIGQDLDVLAAQMADSFTDELDRRLHEL